jgi:hypothetical protein
MRTPFIQVTRTHTAHKRTFGSREESVGAQKTSSEMSATPTMNDTAINSEHTTPTQQTPENK